MRVRSGRSNRVAAALLLPALLATAPAIRSCPLSPSDPATYYRCLLLGPSTAAAMPAASCADPASCQAKPDCGAESEAACAAGGCPLMEHGVRTTATPHPWTYCVGDPAGGYGLRSAAPQVSIPDRLDAIVIPAVLLAPGPIPVQTRNTELRARPPTQAPEARPPVRGPPAAI